MSHFLYSPLSWGLLLAVVLLWRWSRMGRGLRALGMAFGALLLLLCTPLGANLLVRAIELQSPPRAACADASADPVVLLSGGFDRPPESDDDYAALNPQSWRRLRGGVLWLRAHPDSALWISGGGPYPVKESDVLGLLARDWGVRADRLHIEHASTTTWDSARVLRDRLPARMLLATSALHLPRATIAFRAAGFRPCPLPTDSQYIPPRSLAALIPQVSAMEKTEEATYEIAGTAYYLLRAAMGHAEATPGDGR